VWFNISKEGKGKETEYAVAFHQTRQKMNGQLVKIDDRSPLPEHVVANYESLAYDLGSIYIRKNYDELRGILLFNIALIAQEVPEVVLPGYDVSEIDVKTGASVVKKTKDVEEEETPASTVKKAAPKVTLNLDGDDDEVSTPTPATVRKTVPAPVKAPEVKRTVVATQPVKKTAATQPTKTIAPVQSHDDDEELTALTAEILGD
jgi:hypothetical protein